MSRRILVIGGDNFVGRRVIAALRASDWALPVSDRHIAGAAGEVETLSLDWRHESSLAQALGGFDAVVNGFTGNPAALTAQARALFAACASLSSQPRIVHLSSMTVYGAATGDIGESADLRADLGPYAKAKIEAERSSAACRSVVLLRPGCEYGPDCPQWSTRIAALLRARRLGDLGAGGDGYCNLLFIDDYIAAILQSLRQPGIEGQAFNLAMPQPPTWNEYFMSFARALRAVPVRRIPRRNLKIETKLLAPPLKIAEILLQKTLGTEAAAKLPPAITPSLLDACRQEIRLNPAKAEQVLGIRWTPLDAGLTAAACD